LITDPDGHHIHVMEGDIAVVDSEENEVPEQKVCEWNEDQGFSSQTKVFYIIFHRKMERKPSMPSTTTLEYGLEAGFPT